MGTLLSWLRRKAIHPFVFGVFPVVSLIASNVDEVRPKVGLRSLMVAAALAGLTLLIAQALLRNWHRAALVSTAFSVLFYSYGAVYSTLDEFALGSISLGRHRYLLPAWFLLGLVVVWLVSWRIVEPARLTAPANGAGMVMLVLAVVSLGLTELGRNVEAAIPGIEDQLEQAVRARASAEDTLPDIYFIILDAYGRQDVLQREYGFDNAPFIEALEERGFTVADCGVSSYAQTELSFASTLNMSPVQDLLIEVRRSSTDRSVLWPHIRDSIVRQVLERAGYRTIAFETGFRWSELEDADYYLSSPTRAPIGLNAFEATLLRSTVLWALADASNFVPGFLLKDFDRSAEEHYLRVQYVLDQLPTLDWIEDPKFVFAHIVSPHGPYVFGSDGEFVDYSSLEGGLSDAEFADAYLNQIRYLNRRLLATLDQIRSQSEVAPVIILQSDHGPERGGNSDRMTVLNAISVPSIDSSSIPSDRALVNTFRIVFNGAFDTTLEYLPDTSYYSTYDAPFEFQIVPNICGS